MYDFDESDWVTYQHTPNCHSREFVEEETVEDENVEGELFAGTTTSTTTTTTRGKGQAWTQFTDPITTKKTTTVTTLAPPSGCKKQDLSDLGLGGSYTCLPESGDYFQGDICVPECPTGTKAVCEDSSLSTTATCGYFKSDDLWKWVSAASGGQERSCHDFLFFVAFFI